MVASFEAQEDILFKEEVAQVEEWWKVNFQALDPPRTVSDAYLTPWLQSPRWAGLVRPYMAEQVVSKRGTITIDYPSNAQGKKLFKSLKEKYAKGEVSHTYGA